MLCIFYLVVVLCASAYGRIAITDKLTDVLNDNVLDNEIKITTHTPTIHPGSNETSDNITLVNDPLVDIVDNTINYDGKTSIDPLEIKIDNGTALILTKFLEEGRSEEARNASRVDPSKFLGIESYSGYLTVNKTYNSNLFFWYFPVLNTPVNGSPWIIWLQGGPGASSLIGLFEEIGPFKYVGKEFGSHLIENRHTWLKNHSIVFIDNPVGCGYSFTESDDGYAKDMHTYTLHLYTALTQFLQVFPELRTVPLYIAGESYAGKYIPALALAIHTERRTLDINLQGLMMGNAFIEPSLVTNITSPMYNFGVLDRDQVEFLRPYQESLAKYVDERNGTLAKEQWMTLVSLITLITYQRHIYNIINDSMRFGEFEPFLTRSDIKRALHVGDIEYTPINITVNSRLANDFVSTTRPMVEALLEHYRVLAYCGQLDQMLPCVTLAEHYRAWRWARAAAFRRAPRQPYLARGERRAYMKSGGGLTEVIVLGAGHAVPADAPDVIARLVADWTHGPPGPPPGLRAVIVRNALNQKTHLYMNNSTVF